MQNSLPIRCSFCKEIRSYKFTSSTHPKDIIITAPLITQITPSAETFPGHLVDVHGVDHDDCVVCGVEGHRDGGMVEGAFVKRDFGD